MNSCPPNDGSPVAESADDSLDASVRRVLLAHGYVDEMDDVINDLVDLIDVKSVPPEVHVEFDQEFSTVTISGTPELVKRILHIEDPE